MTWVGWRLQRGETWIALGVLALLAALLVPTGLSMAGAFHQDALGSCLSINSGPSCGARIGEWEQRFQSLIVLGNWFTLIPGLLGVLLAAPFIFDLEHRTYRLVWTQGITRGRWLRGKFGLAVVTAVVVSGALIALFAWWRSPQAKIDGWLDNGTFDTAGVVVFGYTLFALGLAAAVGAVWRRAAASIAVAFVGYFALRVYVEYAVRHHLAAPQQATWRGTHQPGALYHAIVLSQAVIVNGVRHVLGGGPAAARLRRVVDARAGLLTRPAALSCRSTGSPPWGRRASP